jgi:N-acetylglucosaminyl-diphospho-decaprenol L-rhamnosyltransferase
VPSSAPAPLLDVVIVTCSGARDLVRDCLQSLREHPLTTGTMRVHVVDNASDDGTPEMVRAEFGEVVVHALDHNSGFSAANNVVLRETRAPFVLLLNPDTAVHPGVLDHMVGVMRDRPDVGIAGCRLVQRDGTLDHAAKRSFPTPLGALAHFTGIGRRVRAPRALAQYRAPELGELESGPVDAVNGAFMLVRRDAIDDVGLLDEGYWLYMEDLDWCLRFHQRGWGVWYDGAVTTLHVKGGTSMRRRHRSPRSEIAFHRSMGRFYRKFQAGPRASLDTAVYVAIVVKLAVSLTRGAIARRGLG